MLTAIETAKRLVSASEWPRPIQDFPKDSNLNCWGFALDGLKIPVLQRRTWYSSNDGLENEIFDFLQSIGLNPRKLSAPEEKFSEEMVFLFYIFEYEYSNISKEIWETRSECHAARIELDGTVVEKADDSEAPVVTSLKEINQRLLEEFGLDVNPILIAVQKPR